MKTQASKFFYFLVASICLPVLAQAATLTDLVNELIRFLDPVVRLLLSLAVVFFLWNGVRFMRAEGDDRGEYRQAMLWGVIAIAVMVSLWGLANILITAFGLEGNNIQNIPKINVTL